MQTIARQQGDRNSTQAGNGQRGRRLLLKSLLLLISLTFLLSLPAAAAPLAKKKLVLYAGETYKLTTSNFPASAKWKSSKKSVASVSRGVVTAKKAGTAVIKAVSAKGSASCKVTVRPLALSSKTLTASRYGIAELTLNCSHPEMIRWTSSAPSIAQVYGQGQKSVYIYGKTVGKAIIQATYMNKSLRCVVHIEENYELQNFMTEADLGKKSPLYGKTIAVYGSSNEVGLYNSSKKSWVDLLKEKLGGIATVINHSKGGNNVVRSVERIAEDPDLSTYDIILVTTVRNTYRGNLPLPSEEDPRGFLKSLYTLSGLIDRSHQTVYFASCLPYTSAFRSLSNTMSIYDALVYKTCRKLGFKYLDMHSWLGITDEEATKFTSDGAHYLASVHPVLAEHCLSALERGGETLKGYEIRATGDQLLKAISLAGDSVTLSDVHKPVNYYAVDTDLNVTLYLWLVAAEDIADDGLILDSPISGVSFYPVSSCLYGSSWWGTFRMHTDGSVTKDKGLARGTTFAVQINSRSMFDAGL